MGREENALIYKDTEKLCKEHPVLVESIKNSLAGQEIHLTPAPAAERRNCCKRACPVILPRCCGTFSTATTMTPTVPTPLCAEPMTLFCWTPPPWISMRAWKRSAN